MATVLPLVVLLTAHVASGEFWASFFSRPTPGCHSDDMVASKLELYATMRAWVFGKWASQVKDHEAIKYAKGDIYDAMRSCAGRYHISWSCVYQNQCIQVFDCLRGVLHDRVPDEAYSDLTDEFITKLCNPKAKTTKQLIWYLDEASEYQD
ncbi:uncharacterized protein LOC135398856 [Ornithodoros turicata]|uniref:uncharacterized protein LOC135398856 n=1 Tax=Ornithodoros turicata TaxID=34597 RepID=UPI003139C7BD